MLARHENPTHRHEEEDEEDAGTGPEETLGADVAKARAEEGACEAGKKALAKARDDDAKARGDDAEGGDLAKAGSEGRAGTGGGAHARAAAGCVALADGCPGGGPVGR